MKRNEQGQHHGLSRQNLKRQPKEEVLEWSPTGYGFISAVQQNNAEKDSEDY